MLKYILPIITTISLGVAAVALRYAYLCLPSLRSYLMVGIGVVVVYIIVVLWITSRLSGARKWWFHCLMLQVIPVCMAAGTFLLSLQHQMNLLNHLNKSISCDVNKVERTFNDLQSKQIVAAKRLGVTPLNGRKDVAKYLDKSGVKLTKISSNSLYYVRNLAHSVPYLIPEAETLLSDLAREFQRISGSKSRFEVTSVLRTKEDVKKLQGVNANATTNSCHCYATTFDISYVHFRTDKFDPKSNAELREALSQAVSNLRKQGRCYVKFEQKQKCYHITVC